MPPFSIYVKRFSPSPAPSESHRQLFTDSEWRRRREMPHKSGSQKRKEKKLRQEKDTKSRQYATQFFHWKVNKSMEAKF
ncbi:hypothetical protein ATANTOWER_004219 [Ataeniobius toweri]|uniref:Uncharacterized protein n=1 Tax=Ataeniobius toweri TaxID=208326 RepID=A0ABU7ANC3_9TELE|nr:hypothetical protein [Ataeniobius toweri]